ncbi:hypothetical protein VWM73_12315, partial [Campylobacter coli]
YQKDYYWWWDYDSYDEFLRSIKQDHNTKLIEKGELTSSSEPILILVDPIRATCHIGNISCFENVSKNADFVFLARLEKLINSR